MGVETQLDTKRLGQFDFVQAVQLVEAVIEVVQLLATGFLSEQLTQGALDGRQ